MLYEEAASQLQLRQGASSFRKPTKPSSCVAFMAVAWLCHDCDYHAHYDLTWDSPGVNRQQTVLRAFCYGRELFFYHAQPRKTAWGTALPSLDAGSLG